jgi:hypothetical protein
VASTAAGEGIMLINDRSKYKEWEFVYDFKNDKSQMGAVPGMLPQQPGQMGAPGVPGQPPMQPGIQPQQPFGPTQR